MIQAVQKVDELMTPEQALDRYQTLRHEKKPLSVA